jgi:uncharacterized protein YkwD/uncharacterized membrane protein required for colicin V production
VTDTSLDQVIGQVAAFLGAHNPVDVVLVVFLGLYALDGIRRGFIAGALGLAAIFLTLLVALRAAPVAGEALAASLGMPPVLANVLGFFVVLIVAQVVMALAVRFVLGSLKPVRAVLAPLAVVDHALGFIPGLVQAAIIATLVLTPLQLFPILPQISGALEGSTLAREVPRRVMSLAPQLEALAGRAAASPPAIQHVVSSSEQISIPRQASVQVDPYAEARLLELLNGERARAGLRPLVADDQLRAVARGHSEEMFKLGYFAHESPRAGTPADRLRAARIRFVVSGENLAYAPTTELAHAGLMASPGHRANILTPEYTRVGIGVVSAGPNGRMFTQNFAA